VKTPVFFSADSLKIDLFVSATRLGSFPARTWNYANSKCWVPIDIVTGFARLYRYASPANAISMAVVDRTCNGAVAVDCFLWFAAFSAAGRIDWPATNSRGCLNHMGVFQTTSKAVG
jgi:hypothetical protein